jgi:porin
MRLAASPAHRANLSGRSVAIAALTLVHTGPAVAEGARADSPLVNIAAAYTADGWWNTEGGLQEGMAYLDLVQVALGFDAGRAFELGSIAVFASVVRANQATFSDRYVGDALVVSNIDARADLQFQEAWIDWGFGAFGSGSVRAGLYDVNTEFDTTESRRLFLNSAYGIGHDLAQTGQNGPSIFPDTGLAVRLAWEPVDRLQLKLAALDAVPGDPNDSGRSRWHVSRSEGALWIAEASTGMGRVATISAGYWRYGHEFADLLPRDDEPEDPRGHDNAGGYVTAEFSPEADPTDGEPRWSGFLRVGSASGHVNEFDRYFAAGVVLQASWPKLRSSQLGLAVSAARASTDYRTIQAQQGLETDSYECNVELTWRIPVTDHVVLQPDLQYVMNPSVDAQLDDALAIGLRLELSLVR